MIAGDFASRRFHHVRRATPSQGLRKRPNARKTSASKPIACAALAELSDSDRALIHLYYFEQRGLAEIAQIMETPRETLKTRLARARGRLRKLLEDPGET